MISDIIFLFLHMSLTSATTHVETEGVETRLTFLLIQIFTPESNRRLYLKLS